jgi:hypothetical protein
VGYVELSVGLGDIVAPWMWRHLAQPDLKSEDAKRVQVRYLAAFGRGHCWIPLSADMDAVEAALQIKIAAARVIEGDESDAVRQARAALDRAKAVPLAFGKLREQKVAQAEAALQEALAADSKEHAPRTDLATLEGTLAAIIALKQLIVDQQVADGNDSVDRRLQLVAAVIRMIDTDDNMYLRLFKAKEVGKLEALFEAFALSRAAQVPNGVHALVVGVDLVGDEFLYPLSPFSASKLIGLIAEERIARDGHFGLRLHAGEVALGTVDKPSDATLAHLAAVSHAVTRYASIMEVFDEHANIPFLRVGHGVLFHHAIAQKSMGTHTSRALCLSESSKVDTWLTGGKVPIEINQTSNSTLLSNARDAFFSLRARGATVVLATDDDGIWQCESADKRYVSVAYEFYCAIVNEAQDKRLTADGVSKIVADTARAAFGKW